MNTQIKFKRGLNGNLEPVVLSAGEPAFTTDTGKLYIGNGATKVLINPINKPIGITVDTFYTKFKINEYGQVINTAALSESDLPTISSSKITGLGTTASTNTGISPGNVPVLDATGKLVSSILPSIAITDTFVVSKESEMLALNAEIGDIAIRSDINETFILKTIPATVLANWIKLLTPADSVTSVNGKTGVVSLAATDILMTSYVKPDTTTTIKPVDTTLQAIGKLEKGIENLAPINSPRLTGTPTAPTPLAGDNSTLLATTAFVFQSMSVIDGGTFQ
ncbi:MAG: hypothetical protein RR359_05350 [Bacilli bacterium]